jgi:hypothetical protein
VLASPLLIQVKLDFYLALKRSIAVMPRTLALSNLFRTTSFGDRSLISYIFSNCDMTSQQITTVSLPKGINCLAQLDKAIAIRANLMCSLINAF